MSADPAVSKADETDAKPTAKRIQFEFAPDAYQRLQKMKDETEASSYADVVRNALRLYEWFITQQKEGYEIGLIKDDRLVKAIKFYF
jgi:predicted CopG family antitoxin